MMEIKDLVSPIDKSGWMADVLTQHIDQLLNTFYNEK
jgi:hypothetical protein